MTPKHVVILGAGLSGLAAARDLLAGGLRVTVLDPAKDVGGLASSFVVEGRPIERFYHFICRHDDALVDLVRELGLEHQLEWHAAKTAFFYEGKHYRFGSPLDLLRFDAIPFDQRIRFGIHIMRSRFRKNWRWLDQIPAKPWVIENVGERAYEVIWHPLLKVKFGDDYETISAAWLWHRIWRVASSRKSLLGSDTFGVLRAGSATIVDEILRRMSTERAFQLRTETRAQKIELDGSRARGVLLESGERIDADAVLSTAALPVLDRLVGPREEPYFVKARSIRYIGVVCVVLSLKKPISEQFWMNVNDSRITFNGIISQSNLNRHLREAGLHIAYVPFYLPTTHPRYAASDSEVYTEVIGMLPRINPAFSEAWVKEWRVFRAPHAQAVCGTHFAALVPDHRSPLARLYVTDSAQFYPEDRTLSMAIAQGRLAARYIQADLQGEP